MKICPCASLSLLCQPHCASCGRRTTSGLQWTSGTTWQGHLPGPEPHLHTKICLRYRCLQTRNMEKVSLLDYQVKLVSLNMTYLQHQRPVDEGSTLKTITAPSPCWCLWGGLNQTNSAQSAPTVEEIDTIDGFMYFFTVNCSVQLSLFMLCHTIRFNFNLHSKQTHYFHISTTPLPNTYTLTCLYSFIAVILIILFLKMWKHLFYELCLQQVYLVRLQVRTETV